jgi:hypothetical protein
VCDELMMHSINKANESAAIFIASAAPIIVIQVMGLFHFMHIISHHSSLSFFGGLSIKAENKNTDAAISPANISPIN